MINIPIDSKNISLKNLHHTKIKITIEDNLISERNNHLVSSLIYQLLDWIISNIEEIIIGEVPRLRNIIENFQRFIFGFSQHIIPTVDDYNSSLITHEELKQICRDDNISGFSINKEPLANHIIMNMGLISNTNNLNNQLKFRILENKINIILSRIFTSFYENNWDDVEDYSRYDFVIKHGLKSCPYCNRNYIFVVNKDGNKLRPEIDHFYPKSIYPFLAMSFYNLIPSCQICNHTKKDKDAFKDKLKSPYEINFYDFKFKYKPKNITFYQIKKNKYRDESFELLLNKTDSVEKNDEYFKLKLLYEQHKDIVLDLLLKKVIYSKSYIKELQDNFKLKDDEIYRFLLCNYLKDEDLHKRPLSKLVKDISEDIGLLSNIK